MLRIFSLAVVSAAALLAPPAAIGAELVASIGSDDGSIGLPLAPGPGGRAIVLVGGGGAFAERAASGRWTVRSISRPGLFPTFSAWGPGGAAAMLATANHDGGGADAFVLRRPAGDARFGAPVALDLGGVVYDRLRAASDARGDIAVLTAVNGPDAVVRMVMATAARGGGFGPPQELGPGYPEDASLAVAGGRVVVAYYRGRALYGRTGTMGSSLGAPHLLTTTRGTGAGAAIDDAGNATIAFDRRGKSNFDHALVVARARAGRSFEAPVVLARSTQELGFSLLRVAAAGTTTALLWQSTFTHGEDGEAHVAIARGAGRFGRSEAPSAPSGRHGMPILPVVAVDRAGDVLLAYPYSSDGAIHAALRRAGRARFGPLHVITRLGEGGTPSVAFGAGRQPLVVYRGRGGAVLARTRVTGPRPDLRPPRVDVRFSRGSVDELRSTNAVTVTIRCSQACMLQSHASLRAHGDRTVAPGVSRRVLRRGAAFTERFAFDPGGRAGSAHAGGRVRVTVVAQNASGASSEVAKQLTL